MNAKITERFQNLGFILEHTGGNTTAYTTQNHPDGRYLLVTREDEPEVPDALSERVCLCEYEDCDERSELYTGRCEDLLLLLESVKALLLQPK